MDATFSSPVGECVIPLPLVAALPPFIFLRTSRAAKQNFAFFAV